MSPYLLWADRAYICKIAHLTWFCSKFSLQSGGYAAPHGEAARFSHVFSMAIGYRLPTLYKC